MRRPRAHPRDTFRPTWAKMSQVVANFRQGGATKGNWGPTWAQLGSFLASFGPIFGSFWGASKNHSQVQGSLKNSVFFEAGAQLGATWLRLAQLGPTWRQLGANLGPTWVQLGPSSAKLGQLGGQIWPARATWANLGQFGFNVGPSWANFGTNSAPH